MATMSLFICGFLVGWVWLWPCVVEQKKRTIIMTSARPGNPGTGSRRREWPDVPAQLAVALSARLLLGLALGLLRRFLAGLLVGAPARGRLGRRRGTLRSIGHGLDGVATGAVADVAGFGAATAAPPGAWAMAVKAKALATGPSGVSSFVLSRFPCAEDIRKPRRHKSGVSRGLTPFATGRLTPGPADRAGRGAREPLDRAKRGRT